MAVGSSKEDEGDTAEGSHVWKGDRDYDKQHAEKNLDRERKEGRERGNKQAKAEHDKYWRSVDVKRVIDEANEREAKREKRNAAFNLLNPITNKIPVFNPLTNPLSALDMTRDIYTLAGGDADDIPTSGELLGEIWRAIEEAFGPFW